MTETSLKNRALIQILSEAPDSQLASSLAERCQDWLKGEDPFSEDFFLFMADLRDQAIYVGGASSFVMQIFQAFSKDLDAKIQQLDDHQDAFRNRTDILDLITEG